VTNLEFFVNGYEIGEWLCLMLLERELREKKVRERERGKDRNELEF
jgi:hypothetical protein